MISKYTTLLVREESADYNELEPKSINTPGDAVSILRSIHLDMMPEERMYMLALNVKNDVLGITEVSKGGLHRTVSDPREMFRTAILLNAASVIVAHNHPSGDPTPSIEDIKSTERVNLAGELLGIPLADHIVISENSYFSFREGGLLN